MFGVPPNATSHTVRDAKADIRKMQKHLLEKGVTKENVTRTTPPFVDPMKSGLDTMMKGDWLQKQLESKVEDNLQSEENSRGELDLDYELYDTDM